MYTYCARNNHETYIYCGHKSYRQPFLSMYSASVQIFLEKSADTFSTYHNRDREELFQRVLVYTGVLLNAPLHSRRRRSFSSVAIIFSRMCYTTYIKLSPLQNPVSNPGYEGRHNSMIKLSAFSIYKPYFKI